MNIRALTYLIYILAWQGLVWIGGFYLMLEHGWSLWWVILMVYLSICAYKPKDWPIN